MAVLHTAGLSACTGSVLYISLEIKMASYLQQQQQLLYLLHLVDKVNAKCEK